MSNNKSILPPNESLAEAAFVVLQMSRALRPVDTREQSVDNTDSPVLFGELVHYIQGNSNVNEERIQSQIGQNLAVRCLYNQLLDIRRVAVAPVQAQAASGDTVEQRKTRSFTLIFKRSRANSDQVYILLTVLPESELEDGYCPVILASNPTSTKRLCFPPLKDHSAQLLRRFDDEALQLAQESEAELSLV